MNDSILGMFPEMEYIVNNTVHNIRMSMNKDSGYELNDLDKNRAMKKIVNRSIIDRTSVLNEEYIVGQLLSSNDRTELDEMDIKFILNVLVELRMMNPLSLFLGNKSYILNNTIKECISEFNSNLIILVDLLSIKVNESYDSINNYMQHATNRRYLKDEKYDEDIRTLNKYIKYIEFLFIVNDLESIRGLLQFISFVHIMKVNGPTLTLRSIKDYKSLSIDNVFNPSKVTNLELLIHRDLHGNDVGCDVEYFHQQCEFYKNSIIFEDKIHDTDKRIIKLM
jgi:hypothetical protein